MHVIHVDTEGQARARVADALEARGATVTGVDSAAAAVEHLPAADCLVCEHDLPDGDAVSLVERVRESDPELPVVVYTDDGSESLAGAAVAAGADGYVPKAEGPSVLGDRVAALAADDRASRRSLVVEQAPVAIVEWDLGFRVADWNPAASALFGYDRETAMGRTAWDLVVPDEEREAVERVWSRLLEDETVEHGVNENVRADGRTVTCEWHNAPMTDADGEVVGVLSFVRDVGDEVRRADRMEALQATSRAMMAADTREEIAADVVDAAEAILDQPVTSVRLYDPDENVLETAAMSDRTAEILGEVVDDPPPVGPGDGPVWDAYRSGEPTVLESLSPETGVYDEGFPVESLLFQPLGDHGVLVFGALAPDAFGETDVNLASVLGTTATAAMDSTVRARELEQAEAILEAAGDGVFALDEDGRYVHFNDRFLEMVGYDREELRGAHPRLFLDESDVERARRHVRELVTGDADVVTYEMTIQRPDGSTLPVEVNQSKLPGEAFTGTVGTARDVTERERMEAALRERKEKIERLHDVAARLEASDDEAEICELTVEAAEGILEFEDCAVRLVDGDDLVLAASTVGDEVPERRPVDEGLYGRTYRTGETQVVDDVDRTDEEVTNPWGYRSLLSVPLGDHGVLHAATTPGDAYDEEDAELAELLAAHATNALDRVAFEAELRTERDRMAALFDNVPDPVVSARHVDDGVVVESVNPAFEETFGYDADDVVGEGLDELIVPPGDRERAARLNERGRAGELVVREVRRRTAEGLRDFVLTVVPVDLDEESPLTFGVYTDVTEQKQRRERVEVLNRVLRHDLRNGMNIVRGAAELLVERVDGDGADYAESIVEQAEQLLTLTDRTRAVERAFDYEEVPAEPLDVVEVLERAVADVRSRYPAADVTLSSAVDAAVVRGGSLLELALVDVLENAVVHNDRSVPDVDVDVRRDGEDVVVTVADDGPGIPASEQRLLTGDEEITQLQHASGLGLWLVNWAVTHAGGDLTFADNDPRGSVVTVRLPLVDAGARAPPVEGSD